MSLRGPQDIPLKEIIVCVILLVGIGLVIYGATSPDLTPEVRIYSIFGGALLIVFLLGGSAKLGDLLK